MYSFVKTHLTVYLIKIWHITLCKSYLRHIFKGSLGRRTAFAKAQEEKKKYCEVVYKLLAGCLMANFNSLYRVCFNPF